MRCGSSGKSARWPREGATGSLRALWDTAASRLAGHNDELLQDSLRRLRAALKVDGEVVDCDKTMPFRLLQHAWKVLNDHKARIGSARRSTGSSSKLSDILAAEFVQSDAGPERGAAQGQRGRAAAGGVRLCGAVALCSPRRRRRPRCRTARRRRIEGLLSVLKAQRFFPAAGRSEPTTDAVDLTTSCSTAAPRRSRPIAIGLPEMTELAKAMAIAELEIEGSYNAATHDLFFARFGANGLDPRELALFPDYLICVAHRTRVSDVLKALSRRPAGEGPGADRRSPGARRCARRASDFGARQPAAHQHGDRPQQRSMSCSRASSNLFQLREQIFRGLAYPGPALFNVFSGATPTRATFRPI